MRWPEEEAAGRISGGVEPSSWHTHGQHMRALRAHAEMGQNSWNWGNWIDEIGQRSALGSHSDPGRAIHVAS